MVTAPGQVAGADGVAAVGRDHPGAHVVDGDEGGDGRAGLGERLEDQGGVEAGQAGAAHVLGHVHGGEAEGGGLLQHVAGDAFGLPGLGVGGDLRLAEVAGHVADRLLFLGEREVHQSSQGLKRRTPVPSKSRVLRVQRVRSWCQRGRGDQAVGDMGRTRPARR